MNSERLLLRVIQASDIENVYKGLSHPQVIPFYGVSYHSLEATQEQMDWYANLLKSESGIWWAVCSPDNQVFYGAGGLNDINKEHQKAELGFWLLPEFWGKGYMQEAIPMILNYAFNELNLHRIEGFVESKNANCKRAMEKLAFSYEGTMRDCEQKNGEWISLDIFSKLSTDNLGSLSD